MRRGSRVASTLLALFALACDPPDQDALAARLPIVDGTRELGEPAVVLVEIFGGAGMCTGTLITPSVVLTAKHCVQASGADEPYPASAFTIGVGNRIGETEDYRVRWVGTTPGAYTTDNTVGLRGAIVGIDVGVLVLRDPVPDVTPIPIRRDRPDDRIGQEFTAIGFGQRPEGGAGSKYKTTGTLETISGTVLYTSEVICSGDSGGPMIQELPERRVIGVASFGQAGSCPSARDGYNAIFEQLDLIDRAILISGGCVDLGEEVCDSIDNDCDEEIDEGCAAIGESCAADTDCAFAQLPGFVEPLENPVRCEDLGAGSVCTRACDPLVPSTECTQIANFGRETVTTLEGLYCRRTSGCDGRCAVGAAGGGADGSSCTADTDCASLSCADPGDGTRRCLPACRSGDATCPVGEACAAALGECAVCVDAGVLRADRQIGEPCESDAECAGDGTCRTDDSGSYCTRACADDDDDDCPSTFHCAGDVCVRGSRARTGDPCLENGDCRGSDFCANQGERRWCSHQCADATECPAGMECVPAGGAMVCAPEGMLLGESCSAAGECGADLCESGVCTRACGASASCPSGFTCQRDGEGNARCLVPPPQPSEGCSAAPGRSSSPVWMLLALGAIALVRRRARRT